MMSVVAKSAHSNEHAVNLLSRLGKGCVLVLFLFVVQLIVALPDERVPQAAVSVLLPVLMDRLADSPGEHLHAVICQALVRMAVSHPSTDVIVKVTNSRRRCLHVFVAL
jgi:hypothetical protein